MSGITAPPVGAAFPGPVIPVDGPPETGPDDGSEPDSADPGEDEPPPGAYQDCLLGTPASAANGRADSAHDPIGRLAAHPGPVIPVDTEALPPCPSTVSLALVVVSRDDRKPDGADATFAGETVARPALESGFSVDVPAETRTIRLSDPGEDWKLMDVSCSCDGGTAASLIAGRGPRAESPLGRLTSYPGPVVPVSPANEPPGAQSGAMDCPGVGSSGSDVASWGAGVASAGPAMLSRLPLARSGVPSSRPYGVVTSQPGPIIPVTDGEPDPSPPEPPDEPPGREPGGVRWDRQGTVNIDDPDQAGGVFSCTWTVEHGRGDLVLETKTDPAGRERRFSYQATPQVPGLQTETIPGSSPGVERKMWKGAWSLAMQKPSDAWELESSECTEADPTTPSSAQGETGTAGIDPSDRVTCTYEMKLLAPKEGRWRGNEPSARLSCGGGVSFRIPRNRDTGQLRVRRDGMRLIFRGFSQGEATWRLDRENEDSRRYSGQVKYTAAGGEATFTLNLDMVSEERMKGTFKGDMRLRGQRCKVNKKITLDHIGG